MKTSVTLLFSLLTFHALAFPCPAGSPAATRSEPTTLIGVAKIDITPETPIRMYGYASRTTESTGIAGRLSAKALAIGGDEGPGPAVLLCVDNDAVPGRLREAVYQRVNQQASVAPERFVLCNSHCHSGPDLEALEYTEGEQYQHLEHYAAQLTDRLVQVVEQALADRQLARLELACGQVEFATNRRVLTDGKWTGFGTMLDAPTDHELAVLRVVTPDGRILALVSNYACHNTTLGEDFRQIHEDWAGCAQQAIEADHPGTTALITIGCGADANPRPRTTVELCERHGRALADEVSRLLAGSWTPIAPTVTAQQRTLEIPWRRDVDWDDARAAARSSYTVQAALSRLDQGATPDNPHPYRITTWTFADELAMVFLSHEVVVDYARRLKQEFDPQRLWITAYTNDVETYIVSPRLIQEGGYEPNNSLSAMVTFGQPTQLDPPMLERIVGAVREMLPETFRAR